MSYYNQRNYGHVAYPAPGYENATLKSAGCGPCSAAMMAEQLTGGTHGPEEMAQLAQNVGARVSGGTDLRRLGSALCVRLGLKMETGGAVLYQERILRVECTSYYSDVDQDEDLAAKYAS